MANNIENRIVQMKFDNEQFESAVAKTMDTLDKFKEKLNFDGSSKGLDNLGKSTNNYNYSLNDIGQSLDQLNGKFSTMGNVGRRVIENLTDSAYKFATKGISVITGSITTGGLNRAKNLEQARFQLQGIFHDAQKVKEVIYSDVLPELRGTPFGLDEAAVVVGQLAASGVQADEDIKQATRAMAGLAAMSGKSFQDVGRVFSKVAGQGNMMGGELQQLSTYGINAAADLAKYFNNVANGSVDASNAVKKHVADVAEKFGELNEKSIRDAASNRMIFYEDLVSAMDVTYGAHAKAANDIFSGAFSNFKAALGRIGAEPAAVGLEVLRNAFNAMTPAIDAINDVLTPFTSATREIVNVGGEMKYAGPMAGTLARQVQELGYSFQRLFVTMGRDHQFLKYTEDNFENLTIAIEETDDAGNTITKHFTKWGREVKIGDTILNDNMWKIVSGSTKSFVNILHALGKALGAIKKGFSAAMPKVTLRMVATFVDHVEKATEAIDKFVNRHLKQIEQIAQGIFTPLGLAVKTGIALLKVFGSVITSVFTGLKPVFSVFLSTGGAIGKTITTFGSMIDHLGAKAPKIGQFVEQLTESIVQFFNLEKAAVSIKRALENVITVFGNTGLKIGLFIFNMLGNIPNIAKTVAELLKLKDAGDLIHETFSKFKRGLDKIFHLDSLRATIEPIIKMIEDFFNQDNFIGKFIENIQTVIDKIDELGWAKDIVDGISTAFSNLTTNISKITEGPIGKVKKFFENIGRTLKEMFASYNEGQFFYTMLANLIPQYATFGDLQVAFQKKVKPFIDTAKELIPAMFGFKDVGEMLSFVANKIKYAGSVIAGFFGLMSGKAVDKASDTVTKIGDAFKEFGKNKIDDLSESLENMKRFFENVNEILHNDAGKRIIKMLVMYLLAFAYFRQLYWTAQSFKSLTDIGKNIANFASSIASGWGIKGINLAIAKVIKLIGIAVALVLFAKAIEILGSMDLKHLVAGAIVALIALIAFTVILTTFSNEVDKAMKAANEAGWLKTSSNTRGNNMLKMATAIAAMSIGVFVVASAIEKIGKLNKGQFEQGLVGALIVLGSFTGIFAIIAALDKKPLVGDLSSRWSKAAFSMVGIAKAVEMMSAAIEKIGALTIDPLSFWQAMGAIIAIMGFMALFADAVKADAKVFSAAFGMIALAGAVIIIVKAIEMLQEAISGQNFAGAVVGMVVIFVAIAMFAEYAGAAQSNLLAAGAGMLLVADAILLMVAAVALLGSMDYDAFGQGLVALAGMLAGIILFAAVANGDLLKAGGGILLLSIGLVALAEALIFLSSVPFGAFYLGLFRCAEALVIFAAALWALSVFMKNMSAKGAMMFVLMAGSILALAVAISLLAGLPIIAVAASLGILILALAAVAGVLALFSGISVGLILAAAAFALLGVAVVLVAAGMFLFVTALAALVPLLVTLASIDMNTLNAGLEVLKTAADGIADALAIMAGAIVYFGLACLIGGIGVFALGAGFLVLSIAGITCALAILSLTGAIVVFVTAMRELFGEGLLSGLGEGLNKAGQFIKQGLVNLFTKSKNDVLGPSHDAGKQMAEETGKGYLEGSSESEEDIREGAKQLFGGNDDVLSQLMHDKGLGFSEDETGGYLEGMDQSQLDILSANEGAFGDIDLSEYLKGAGSDGADLVVDDYATGLGSNQSVSKVSKASGSLTKGMSGLKAGNNAAKKSGEEAAKSYSTSINHGRAGALKAAGEMAKGAGQGASRNNWGPSEGSNAGSGYTSGVMSWVQKAARAAAALVRGAKNAAKKEQNSSSPSKDYMKFGRWASEGYIIGMSSLSGKVSATASDMVRGGLDAVGAAIAYASKYLSSDMDFTPIISPVVDLTNVSKSTQEINSMFDSAMTPFTSDNTFQNLSSIANDFRAKAMDNSDINKTLHKLSGSLDGMTESMNSRSLNNYITVDGASDPEAFADDLIRSFRLNARTV